jgi:hypothetical protein
LNQVILTLPSFDIIPAESYIDWYHSTAPCELHALRSGDNSASQYIWQSCFDP